MTSSLACAHKQGSEFFFAQERREGEHVLYLAANESHVFLVCVVRFDVFFSLHFFLHPRTRPLSSHSSFAHCGASGKWTKRLSLCVCTMDPVYKLPGPGMEGEKNKRGGAGELKVLQAVCSHLVGENEGGGTQDNGRR